MLGLIYLAAAVFLGERLCRRFYRFVSTPQRWAAGALVGLLLSSWLTYLVARVFAGTTNPMLWGNLTFFAVAAGTIFWIRRRPREDVHMVGPRAAGSEKWDWVTLGICFLAASWLMFGSLGFKDGRLQIGNNEWSDFGPNTAIMQSFAVGHNFPTEYPHFAGEPIRYHFLFYFQAGNLEFLGLNPAWSLNILSVLSMVCMLALVMALGEMLFESRAVGRIGAALFFFHGSLSFLPFLRAQSSVAGAVRAIINLQDFLPSGYPYRGELWGIWTQVVFMNQRHLASAIGILLVVLIFLVDRYREKLPGSEVKPAPAPEDERDDSRAEFSGAAEEAFTDRETNDLQTEIAAPVDEARFDAPSVGAGPDLNREPHDSKIEISAPAEESLTDEPGANAETTDSQASDSATIVKTPRDWGEGFDIRDIIWSGKSFIFSGRLLGALPFWNAPVFTAAFIVLLFLFLLFPYRRDMLLLGLSAAVVALPQISFLRSGNVRPRTFSLIHWGYVVDNPTFGKVLKYLGFMFGVKWVLIVLALIFLSWFQRRFFLAISSLILLTFFFQFSDEALANHKFLNTWLILANLFAAYGLWRLWQTKIRGSVITGHVAAVVLAILIVTGGIIDLFPIHNSHYLEIGFSKDRLVEWVRTQTKPDAVFLTDRFVNHQILLAGRRIFYGWPYFTWSAGYDTGTRENIYRQMFESQSPQQVMRLLKDNHIDYVAFDDGVRRGGFIRNPNEQFYAGNFEKVFQDTGNQYGSITIYKVPENPDVTRLVPASANPADVASSVPTVSMFVGGKGTDRGQFDWPRGLAVDTAGNIFVSDAHNGRIQKFSPAGVFLGVIGRMGPGPGELREPNGIAVDRKGNIYVADVLNQRVQKLKPDGSFIAQWKGPDPGFNGPGDIAIGPDNSVYVVDQGHARIVKFDSNGRVLAVWGTNGTGDGEFNEATSVAIDEKNHKVYVADPRNRRIEVFDQDGKFVANWFMEEWQPRENLWYLQDLAVDSKSGRLYASSTATDEVLVFDLSGNKVGSLRPDPPDKLEGASSLALLKNSLYVVDTFAARVSRLELEKKEGNQTPTNR